MPILTLRDCSLHFGHHYLLDHAELIVEPGERTCLIGRNGAGKTSLFNLLLKKIQPDSGEVIYQTGLKIKALEQEVPTDLTGTIFQVTAAGLGEIGQLVSDYEDLSLKPDHDEKSLDQLQKLQEQIEHHNAWNQQTQIASVLSTLGLDPHLHFESLSGGLKRRVLLARALVSEPDLLLLDEPTNHLDIESLEFLEKYLPSFPGSILFITHDRMFLQKMAKRIIELDRGHLHSFDGTYQQFLDFQEQRLESEEKANALFDKRLAEEEVWIRQGIKARRTRNEGRVRRLEALRVEAQERRKQQGSAQLLKAGSERSGKIVIEAENISFDYDARQLISDFSTTVMRGDKIGILGPNGCGKTTILNILLGKLQPKSGTVKLGTNLEVAYFDQLRDQLDGDKTVADNVAGGSEFIELNGQKLHIYSYLKNYLFTSARLRDKVSSLSGGERNRLLLAKILSKPCNVLVLDEPTNDLDLQTLELLEELMLEFKGTLLLVSHDRAFINNVVSSVIAFEGDGVVNEYVGGYDAWVAQRPGRDSNQIEKPKAQKPKSKLQKKGLSYLEEKRLTELPALIEAQETLIDETQQALANPNLYQTNPEKFAQMTEALSNQEGALNALYQEWELLAAQ